MLSGPVPHTPMQPVLALGARFLSGKPEERPKLQPVRVKFEEFAHHLKQANSYSHIQSGSGLGSGQARAPCRQAGDVTPTESNHYKQLQKSKEKQDHLKAKGRMGWVMSPSPINYSPFPFFCA